MVGPRPAPPPSYELRAAGRVGKGALEKTAAETEEQQGAIVAERAKQAMQATSPSAIDGLPATSAQRELQITVISPNGATLPQGFVQQDWNVFQPRWKI